MFAMACERVEALLDQPVACLPVLAEQLGEPTVPRRHTVLRFADQNVSSQQRLAPGPHRVVTRMSHGDNLAKQVMGCSFLFRPQPRRA